MKTVRLSQSTSDLFLRSEIERWLGIQSGVENDLLDALMVEVVGEIEGYLRLSCLQSSFRTTFDLAEYSSESELYLPRPPLVSVASVTSTDDDGVVTTMSASDYQVCAGDPGRLALTPTGDWPSDGRERDSLAVTHVSGCLAGTGRLSQASVNTETIVIGSALTVGTEAEVEYRWDVVTKAVIVKIYGAAASSFAGEVEVYSSTVTPDTTSGLSLPASGRWRTAGAGYAYYRVKVASASPDQHGTVRLLGLTGALDPRITQAVRRLVTFRYRLRGEGFVTNSASGGNVLLTNDYDAKILASISDLRTEFM